MDLTRAAACKPKAGLEHSHDISRLIAQDCARTSHLGRRQQIARHVTQVLVPQGLVLVCTSRPTGLDLNIYERFAFCELCPLSEEQQREVAEQRLEDRAPALLEYVERHIPVDSDTSARVTSNPLMLSMVCWRIITWPHSLCCAANWQSRLSSQLRRFWCVNYQVISIFQSASGEELGTVHLPRTVAELYQVATTTMLERVDRKERGAAAAATAVPSLVLLLEQTFFQAHGEKAIMPCTFVKAY